MSYIKEIGGQKLEIGEYTSYVNNMDVRVKVFTLEVVGLNTEHKHKTDETYLTKLAMGLIFRLIEAERLELIDPVINSLFDAGYTLAGYKAKLYKYTVQSLAEQGIIAQDPMKSKSTASLS